MSEKLKSFLIFENYSISEMEFERNYDFDDEKEIELKFNFQGSTKISENKDYARLEIACIIFEEEFAEKKAPFYLKTKIIGEFGLRVNEKDLNIEDFQYNGLAILLPYLRSIITSFTSQAGMPPVILPAINVYKAFDVVEKNEEDD